MFLCRENNYAVNFKKCKVSPINLLNFYIYLIKILYLIFDYPHKHYTFKYFEV